MEVLKVSCMMSHGIWHTFFCFVHASGHMGLVHVHMLYVACTESKWSRVQLLISVTIQSRSLLGFK